MGLIWWFKKCGLLAIVLVVFICDWDCDRDKQRVWWVMNAGVWRKKWVFVLMYWLIVYIKFFFVNLKSNLIFVFLCLVAKKVHENKKKIWDFFFLIFKIINWNLMLMWNFYSYFFCHVNIKCANCAHRLPRKYFPLVN